jgi:hypothetical protein
VDYLTNRPDLIDAEYAFNEGGGAIRDGRRSRTSRPPRRSSRTSSSRSPTPGPQLSRSGQRYHQPGRRPGRWGVRLPVHLNAVTRLFCPVR